MLILVIIVFFALDVFMFYRHFSMAGPVPDTAEDTLDEDKPALQEKPVPRLEKVTTYHSRPAPVIPAIEEMKIPLKSWKKTPSICAENFIIPPNAKIIRYRVNIRKLLGPVYRPRASHGKPANYVKMPDPGTLERKIGLMKGDKVRSVNGFKIRNNEEDAFELYEKLKNENIIIVEIERDNSIMYLWYKITR
jgi:hypothetical protein